MKDCSKIKVSKCKFDNMIEFTASLLDEEFRKIGSSFLLIPKFLI